MSSPTNAANIVDLFGPTAASAQPPNAKASDDLLQLGNPFADMFSAPPPAQPLVGNDFEYALLSFSFRIDYNCNGGLFFFPSFQMTQLQLHKLMHSFPIVISHQCLVHLKQSVRSITCTAQNELIACPFYFYLVLNNISDAIPLYEIHSIQRTNSIICRIKISN